MTGRPMTFTAESVRAMLAGTKTQTRRVLTSDTMLIWLEGQGLRRPERAVYAAAFAQAGAFRRDEHGAWSWLAAPLKGGSGEPSRWLGKLRYAVGDRLWVREAFIPNPPLDHDAWDDWRCTGIEWNGCDGKVASVPPALRKAKHVIYAADPGFACYQQWRWGNPRYMPRWASRLTLEITDLRIERVKDISEDDARAEGIERDAETTGYWGVGGAGVGGATPRYAEARHAFKNVWNALNAARGHGWVVNPLVIALTFRVIASNIDEIGDMPSPVAAGGKPAQLTEPTL